MGRREENTLASIPPLPVILGLRGCRRGQKDERFSGPCRQKRRLPSHAEIRKNGKQQKPGQGKREHEVPEGGRPLPEQHHEDQGKGEHEGALYQVLGKKRKPAEYRGPGHAHLPSLRAFRTSSSSRR